MVSLQVTFLPVLIFYVVDQRLKLRAQLINQFKTVGAYKITLTIVTLVGYMVYMAVLYVTGAPSFIPAFSVIFLFLYLIHEPERFMDSDK